MHEFIYAGGFSYYNPLKKLYTSKEWLEVFNDLLETFEKEEYKQVFGSRFTAGLIEELEMEYVRRPAFVDELEKIK